MELDVTERIVYRMFFPGRNFVSSLIMYSTLNLTRSSATAEKQRVSCPHGWRGLGPPAHSPFAPSGYTYANGRIRKPQRTYVKRAVRKAHFKMNGHSRSSLLVPIGIQNGVLS